MKLYFQKERVELGKYLNFFITLKNKIKQNFDNI